MLPLSDKKNGVSQIVRQLLPEKKIVAWYTLNLIFLFKFVAKSNKTNIALFFL